MSKKNKEEMSSGKQPNQLINESSPYLLQHAYNPVKWYPWGDEAFKKAKEENKPVIVSIGYSSCHWCHVMEHESFEDEETASIQNELFVSIKVDREERPDVDAVYMEAVQAMGIGGGWPLNVFVTPEGKPFYGGTYFPNGRWKSILKQLADLYQNNPEKVQEQAASLSAYLQQSDVKKYELTGNTLAFSEEELRTMYAHFEKGFDKKWGGITPAPKFPTPNSYQFLLRYYNITKDKTALDQVLLTLDRMAWGGIYDQIGGGFARYSTDNYWIAPHFEKMLYDNAQLVTLYTEAYTITKKELYRDVVYETLAFIEREMTHPEGGFYSAIDADSEGEEGKFYVWSWDELEKLTGDDMDLFADYYNIKKGGNWESHNILYHTQSDEAFIEANGLKAEDWKHTKKEWAAVLMKERNKRIRPGLDDKIMSGWNGLMLKGYADAYRTFGEQQFLDAAVKNAKFITTKMDNGKGLYHTYKDKKATIDGFLEDYALVIEGLLSLYQATFDEKWLKKAKELTDFAIEQFYDENEKLFYFTGNDAEQLIARKKEIFDNVISSSNSVMANNLHFMAHFYDEEHYLELSQQMLGTVSKLVTSNASYVANWAILYTHNMHPTAEIAIVGDDYQKMRSAFDTTFIPNKIMIGTDGKSSLPLLQHREAINGETTIYVCFNKTCKLPVRSAEKAIQQLPEVYR